MPQKKESASTKYQKKLVAALTAYFAANHDVQPIDKEWPITRGASDDFTADEKRYAPRLDVVVGPMNVESGAVRRTNIISAAQYLPRQFAEKYSSVGTLNQNPRFLLVVEVVYSGTSKHVMGDMMNASMMGLYGAVVVNNKENKEKARRIKKYLETVHKLKKSESARFPNLEIFGAKEFINLFRR